MPVPIVRLAECPDRLKVCVSQLAAVFILTISSAPAAERAWQTLVAEGNKDIVLQNFVQAEDCFRRALKAVQRTVHNNDDKVKCIEKLAATLVLENKIEEAMHLYHKSLHILERTYGKGSPKIVPTLFALGSIFESEGDPKEAMELYSRALAINEKNYGPHSVAVADSMHRLGHANVSAGQTEQAQQNYKSSLSILMQDPALSSSKELESLLSDYSDLLRKNDSSDKNLISDFQKEILKDRHGFPIPAAGVPPSTWQKEMAIQSHKSGQQQNNEEQQILLRGFKQPFSESTLKPAYQTMSDVLHNQHPYGQGEDYYQRMVAIDIKALGPNHPSIADDLTGLALLYISDHRYAEAKPLLIRALAIYKSVYDSDNLLVTRTRDYLASVYNTLGEKEKALALYSETVHKGDIILDPNNLETARMLNELAYLYYSQGQLEDASTIYQWALASTRAAVGEQSILVAACLNDYANVLRSMGRTAEAIQMDDQAKIIKLAHADDKGIE